MKKSIIVLSLFLLSSSYAFSGDILKNVVSAGVCIYGFGGKFIFKNLENNSDKNITAYIPDRLCAIDGKYTPGEYKEVEFTNLNNSQYLKKMSFEDYSNGKILTFSEENIQELSSEQKAIIDNLF
jgi:hypothetical protein